MNAELHPAAHGTDFLLVPRPGYNRRLRVLRRRLAYLENQLAEDSERSGAGHMFKEASALRFAVNCLDPEGLTAINPIAESVYP